MENRNFMQMLEAQWEKDNFVCGGLDSEYLKIPENIRKVRSFNIADSILFFNGDVIEATKDLVCAYKLNVASYGVDGLVALKETISYIHIHAPSVPVILDAKRADIGNTNAGYVRAAFDFLQADAITVHPYLGQEALKPFLEQKDKGIIVLCRTSNPGAGKDSRGKGMLINSSRGIIFASNGPDFAEAARRETIKLRDMINQYR